MCVLQLFSLQEKAFKKSQKLLRTIAVRLYKNKKLYPYILMQEIIIIRAKKAF